jgi:hypothetical protein
VSVTIRLCVCIVLTFLGVVWVPTPPLLSYRQSYIYTEHCRNVIVQRELSENASKQQVFRSSCISQRWTSHEHELRKYESTPIRVTIMWQQVSTGLLMHTGHLLSSSTHKSPGDKALTISEVHTYTSRPPMQHSSLIQIPLTQPWL